MNFKKETDKNKDKVKTIKNLDTLILEILAICNFIIGVYIFNMK